MWDAISKLIGLIPVLIRELPVSQRHVVVLGVFTTIFVVVACWLITWRLRESVQTTALTDALNTVLDVKLMVFAAAAIVVILGWVVVVLYSLFWRR